MPHFDELEEGQVFDTVFGSVVKLDRRVPGDGTQWYVATYCRDGRFIDNGTIVEPGDLLDKIGG